MLLAACAVLFVLAGCRSGQPPDEIRVESVALETPDGATAYTPTLDGPLRVLSATPSGAMRSMQPRQAIAVTFSRPMVPLGETPPVPEDAFQTSPQVEGTYRWEGTQTLVFTPDAPLPPATAFEVTLQAAVESRDGETIDGAFTWTFETPRPRLAFSEPDAGDLFVEPNASVALHFTLPVDADDARRYVTFGVRQDDRLAPRGFDLSNATDSTLVVDPDAAMQKGVRYAIELAAGLPTTQGPLGMDEAETLSFRVHPDLELLGVDQPGFRSGERFDPARGVELTFSTPVRFEDVRTAASFNPDLSLPAGVEAQDDQVSRTHTLPVRLAPETGYSLRLDGLTDAFGQSLASTTRAFRTGAYAPTLWMDRGLMVIEAEQYAVVPVRATNVDAVGLGLTALGVDEVIPALRTYDQGRYYGRSAPGQADLDPVPASRRWDLGMERNTPSLVPLFLDSLLTGGTGAVGVRMTWTEPPSGRRDTPRDRDHRALAQVTNLGVTGKFSPHQNLILVTRLSDARPVPGAQVEIRGASNAVEWSGETDAQGRVTTPGWAELGLEKPSEYQSPVQYALVRYQGDLAFTSSAFNDGVEPYRFGLNYEWNPEPRTETGTVFSDRGLYTGGETVHLKSILRTKTDGEWAPVTDSVRVVVRNPRDEVVFDRTMQASGFGTVHTAWTAPEDAVQGPYEVRVASPDDASVDDERAYRRGGIATGTFRVDSFRRATFRVDATSAADAYVAGDFFEGTISARYLFGAGMAGQPVQYRLVRRDTRYEPPGYDAYRFGPLDDYRFDELTRGDTVLDSTSAARTRVQLPTGDTGAPTELAWSGTVEDPSRQTISDRTAATMHPALFYVGLKAETSFLDLSQDSVLTVDVISTDPGGTPVGGKRVTLDLVRKQWDSVREIGADGRARWQSEPTETVVRTTTVTTQADAAQRVRMPVSKGGQYEIRARSQDVRGNVVRTQTYLYASGSGYVAWRRDDDDRVELVPEKTTYAPGETARLMVQSPYEQATALVTVEREGILDSRVQTVTGSTPTIEVPLAERHLPNVYVSVILLNGRTAPPERMADPGAPGFKIGYASLRVDPGQRHLQVAVTPDREQYRPGDAVTVDLRLTDASGDGVAGEVAFSAADAGVLNRIGYALPDPFDTFYGPRPLGVTTSELRSELVEQRSYGQKAEATGGGGGSSESTLRKDFRPLAHWAPAVQTDARGRASVTFDLPESLTTFRFMATAVGEGNRFGQGQTDVVVTQPLVLQPALPRFARRGDLFEAGVLVSNRTGAAGPVTVTAESEGLTLQGGDTQTVTLAAGATREVRFAWDALEAGSSTVRFRATLGDEADAFETTLDVQTPRVTEASAQFASTETRADEALRLPPNRVPGLGGLDVQLASTALVGLDGALEYLFDYPYGCVEQKTSRVRPLLIASDELRTFDLDVLGGRRNEIVTAWMKDLDRYWLGDGYGMWPGARESNPYVSAYVVLALAEAQAAGYDVPQPMTRQAVDALERRVRRSSERPDYYSEAVWADSRAMMLYALARHGRVLETEISTLAEDPPASTEGVSLLLRTVARAGSPVLDVYEQTLADRLRGQIRVEGTRAYLAAPSGREYGWIFSSDARATAFGLSALLASDTTGDIQPVAQRMIRYLMDERTTGHWASTQDNAAVVEAFGAYVDAYEQATPDFSATVRIAGQSVLEKTFAGRSLETASTEVEADVFPSGREVPVSVTKDGTGRLYYTLRLVTYVDGPVQAREQGLQVERRIQRLDDRGEPVGDWMATGRTARRDGADATVTLDAGTLVRVQLRLTSPTDRTYVVVDDALPAGLEPVNAAFQTANQAALREADAGQGRWWGSFNHTELRDDRVLLFADYLRSGEHTYTYVARATTPGTFRHPPAEAEMMYAPETRGRTGSGTFVVEAPGDAQAAAQ